MNPPENEQRIGENGALLRMAVRLSGRVSQLESLLKMLLKLGPYQQVPSWLRQSIEEALREE